MRKYFLLLIFFTVMLFSSEDSLKISYPKLSLAASATVGVMGASYYVMKNTWWSEDQVGFHYDSGADLRYAKNLDKAGHLYGGYIIQDLYYRSLIWSRVDKNSALWWSTGLSIFDQIMIDLKDGFSPEWGFSIFDVLAGTVGSGYGAVQKNYPALENYDIKFSYYKKNDTQYGSGVKWAVEDLIEDYPNQTYWLTANINAMLPEKANHFLPDFLGLAIGLSVDDLYENNELYLSLDFDIEKIVEPLNNSTVSSLAHYLNYLKIPSPTLRFYPTARGYWLYM